ncbi:hypothetical protein [Lysobacter gummosus]|uniref:hypothetical protein n=1 Tax=Lysobacter gummosus TaxID=262324 RepID=UPI00362A6454
MDGTPATRGTGLSILTMRPRLPPAIGHRTAKPARGRLIAHTACAGWGHPCVRRGRPRGAVAASDGATARPMGHGWGKGSSLRAVNWLSPMPSPK